MRIRLTANIYGKWTGKPGDEVDRPDVEAGKLIARGYAVPVKPVVTPPAESENKNGNDERTG